MAMGIRVAAGVAIVSAVAAYFGAAAAPQSQGETQAAGETRPAPLGPRPGGLSHPATRARQPPGVSTTPPAAHCARSA